jgi:hypothetical protein
MAKKKSDGPKIDPKPTLASPDTPLEDLHKLMERVEFGVRNYGATLPLLNDLMLHGAEIWKIVPAESAPVQPPYRASLLGKYCFVITQYCFTALEPAPEWVPNHGAQNLEFFPPKKETP